MIDPEHKTAFIPGAIGTFFAWVLHIIGEYDWSHLAGFLTCILVSLQIIGGALDRINPIWWKKWRKSK
jgi:hypothetical protein